MMRKTVLFGTVLLFMLTMSASAADIGDYEDGAAMTADAVEATMAPQVGATVLAKTENEEAKMTAETYTEGTIVILKMPIQEKDVISKVEDDTAIIKDKVETGNPVRRNGVLKIVTILRQEANAS